MLELSHYQGYDLIITFLFIHNTLRTNANQIFSCPPAIHTSLLNILKYFKINTVLYQTIYGVIKRWELSTVSYETIKVISKKLYAMVDE